MNRLLRPRICASLRASSGHAPCDVLSSTPRVRAPTVARLDAHLHGLVTEIHEISGPAWSGMVVRVSDGDTIKVIQAHKEVKVRLYGIDCSERGQPFAKKAKKVAFDKSGATIRNLSATGCSHEKKRLENQPLGHIGAGNGIRTRDFNLGKVALYL